MFRSSRLVIIATTCRRQMSKVTHYSQRKSKLSRPSNMDVTTKKSRGYILLVMPAIAFGLGIWQVRRWRWKLQLIDTVTNKTKAPPVPFPLDYTNIEELEYSCVRVRGTFDHDKEMYVAPRSNLAEDDGMNSSFGLPAVTGVHVITPFTMADTGLRILINRGWVEKAKMKPQRRRSGQVEGEVEFNAIVRKTERRQQFAPENIAGSDSWYYRDVNKMAELMDTVPIFLDADIKSSVKGGPIGGQTRVNLRNDHFSYIITWFSLGSITTFGWWLKYIKPK